MFVIYFSVWILKFAKKSHEIEYWSESTCNQRVFLSSEVRVKFRSLPSSTFQKEKPIHESTSYEKRPLIFTERLRVSAAPQMSDISEHVISEKNITQDSLSAASPSFQVIISVFDHQTALGKSRDFSKSEI